MDRLTRYSLLLEGAAKLRFAPCVPKRGLGTRRRAVRPRAGLGDEKEKFQR